jgi:hypothetical protein
MKLYKPKPQRIIRVTISRKDEPKEYLNFVETDHKTVIDELQKFILSFNFPCNSKDDRTSLDIRDCIGGTNGRSKTISFVGMSAKKIKEEIIKKYK